MKLKGIDVSKWQGSIDWDKVKKAGIQFAMIRDGYGKKAPNQVDGYFVRNMKGAKSVGIPVGVYHYSYAKSPDDARKEAEFCLENIKGYTLEYPVAFDIEDPSLASLGKGVLTEICKAFCSKIESAGYYCMIYANSTWLNDRLNSQELLSKYDLWFAHYNQSQPSRNCGIFQYSRTGRVDGINGDVDLNYAYKDYPSIIKSRRLNGFR